MTDYLIKEDVFMALTGDITDCTIEEFIARLRDKLSKLPSVGKDINVTTNEDCISRQAVLDSFWKLDIELRPCAIDAIVNMINNLPPVTLKEKTGKWIDDANKIDAQFGRHTYICSECGKYAEHFISGTEVWWDRIKPNFCPNCGAKMEVSE